MTPSYKSESLYVQLEAVESMNVLRSCYSIFDAYSLSPSSISKLRALVVAKGSVVLMGRANHAIEHLNRYYWSVFESIRSHRRPRDLHALRSDAYTGSTWYHLTGASLLRSRNPEVHKLGASMLAVGVSIMALLKRYLSVAVMSLQYLLSSWQRRQNVYGPRWTSTQLLGLTVLSICNRVGDQGSIVNLSKLLRH